MIAIDRTEKSRSVAARWTITAYLTITSAAQIGSHESDYCDMTFSRNDEGYPALHGSTLAGALRSGLNDRLEGYRGKESEAAAELFGSLKSRESAVVVFDSAATSPATASIRDGVRIDSDTGLAADGLKFDREISHPGLVFPVRIDLLVPSLNQEARLVSLLAQALSGLSDRTIRLGARRSRGMGACKTDRFYAVRYDLTTRDGWLRYSRSGYNVPRGTHATAADAIASAFPGLNLDTGADARCRFIADCDLELAGTLLIRSPGEQAGSADMVHLTENGKRILSGTSLAGALRSRARKILKTVQPDKDNDGLLEDLFGSPGPREANDISRTQDLKASRLLVSDGAIAGAASHRQTRVKIDRFTGGALDTALFDEEPAVHGSIGVRIEVRNPCDADIGLVLLLIRDLLGGSLPLGGETSIGRGIVRGKARVNLPGGKEYELIGDDWADATDRLQPYVDSLWALRGDNE